MACVNGYDTIDQAAGTALANSTTVVEDGSDVVRLAPDVLSSCRTADGTWIAWAQDYSGDSIETSFGPLGPSGNPDKSLWPSRSASAAPVGVGFFPDDGSGPVVYELGLKQPLIGWSDVVLYSSGDPCSLITVAGENFSDQEVSVLGGWSTYVADVRVVTDGSLVWVAVLARETFPYPYITNRPDFDACGILHPGLAEFLAAELGFGNPDDDDPFVHDTTDGHGYRWWQHWNGLLGSGPGDDAGESESFRWTPHRLSVYCGDLGGFERIGEVNAVFHNNSGWGLTSGVEAAASPAEPGVMHVLWAEGGTADSYASTYGQRINYSRWDGSGKVLDNDVRFSSTGADHGLPSSRDFSAEWVWTAEMIVRNDHGSPAAIVWPWAGSKVFAGIAGTFGPTGDDWTGPAGPGPAEFWDLSDGTANVIQTMDPGLIPTAEETVPLAKTSVVDQGALVSPSAVTYGPPFSVVKVPRRFHYASSLYEDPTLDGQPVYLIASHMCPDDPDGMPGGGKSPSGACVAYYRVPCDGSDTFSFLDGVRKVGYSIVVGGAVSFGDGFTGFPNDMHADFVSDAENVWMPTETGAVMQLDRQCLKGWRKWDAFPYDPSVHFALLPDATWNSFADNNVSPPTILNLDTGDWIAGAGVELTSSSGYGVWGDAGDEVVIAALRAKICRCCQPCNRTGMHVWETI